MRRAHLVDCQRGKIIGVSHIKNNTHNLLGSPFAEVSISFFQFGGIDGERKREMRFELERNVRLGSFWGFW
jgi:hypothetical protein